MNAVLEVLRDIGQETTAAPVSWLSRTNAMRAEFVAQNPSFVGVTVPRFGVMNIIDVSASEGPVVLTVCLSGAIEEDATPVARQRCCIALEPIKEGSVGWVQVGGLGLALYCDDLGVSEYAGRKGASWKLAREAVGEFQVVNQVSYQGQDLALVAFRDSRNPVMGIADEPFAADNQTYKARRYGTPAREDETVTVFRPPGVYIPEDDRGFLAEDDHGVPIFHPLMRPHPPASTTLVDNEAESWQWSPTNEANNTGVRIGITFLDGTDGYITGDRRGRIISVIGTSGSSSSSSLSESSSSLSSSSSSSQSSSSMSLSSTSSSSASPASSSSSSSSSYPGSSSSSSFSSLSSTSSSSLSSLSLSSSSKSSSSSSSPPSSSSSSPSSSSSSSPPSSSSSSLSSTSLSSSSWSSSSCSTAKSSSSWSSSSSPWSSSSSLSSSSLSSSSSSAAPALGDCCCDCYGNDSDVGPQLNMACSVEPIGLDSCEDTWDPTCADATGNCVYNRTAKLCGSGCPKGKKSDGCLGAGPPPGGLIYDYDSNNCVPGA